MNDCAGYIGSKCNLNRTHQNQLEVKEVSGELTFSFFPLCTVLVAIYESQALRAVFLLQILAIQVQVHSTTVNKRVSQTTHKRSPSEHAHAGISICGSSSKEYQNRYIFNSGRSGFYRVSSTLSSVDDQQV